MNLTVENKSGHGVTLDILRENPPEFSSPSTSMLNLCDLVKDEREEEENEEDLKVLVQAVQRGNIDQVKKELTKERVNHRSPSGWCLIHYVAYFGHVTLVGILGDYGCNFAALTRNGQTAVHLAAWKGFSFIVKALISKVPSLASIESEDDGFTPLHWGAIGGHVAVIDVLLANGAKVNKKSTKIGCTALHFAAQYNHTHVAQCLLTNGADPNSKTHTGDTPLHYASWKGHQSVAMLLLSNHAEKSILNNLGKSAFDEIAKRRGSDDLRQVLASAKIRKEVYTPAIDITS